MTKLNVKTEFAQKGKAGGVSKRMRGFLSDFSKDESGVLVAFSVWFMLMILFVGALGVDVMRFETQRTRLQASLDQAVLAAADLDQKRGATAVVEDYFRKFGVEAELTSVNVDEGLAHRYVEATAQKAVPTQLVHMLGVDEFTAPAASAAEERVENVEISLVLDVSGSMDGTRIRRLKPAAVDFINAVFAQNEANGVTVSIVPYSTQVNVGPNMLDELDVEDGHEHSHCVNILTNDYNHTFFQLKGSGRTYEQTQHFDVFSYSQGDPETDPTNLDAPVCRNDAGFPITPISGNKQELVNAINALTPGGNTSIDLGIKWGATFLDPALRPAVQGLVADGDVAAQYANRPLNYTGDEAIKVMVVMTDGQNTDQFRLPDAYRSGKSDVYYDADNNLYALWDATTRTLYEQHTSGANAITRDPALSTTRSSTYSANNPDGSAKDDEDFELEIKTSMAAAGKNYERLSYPELFASASNAFIAQYIYINFDPDYWNNWYWNPMETVHPGSSKDGHTHTICNAVKQESIVIYTIGFEAPQQAQNLLEACASTRSHYFDVEGVEISDAFAAIAASISQLKLVQ